MSVVSRMASLALAAVALLLFAAPDARAGFDNPSIVDVGIGEIANRGVNCDEDAPDCRSRRAIDENLMVFVVNEGTQYAYGNVSNSNGEPYPDSKRARIFWRINEPESIRRTNRGANLSQRQNAFVQVFLYTAGGTVVRTGSPGDSAELCAAAASATTERDDGSNVRSLSGRFTCRRGYLSEIGFSDDEIDCIGEAFETRRGRATATFRARGPFGDGDFVE